MAVDPVDPPIAQPLIETTRLVTEAWRRFFRSRAAQIDRLDAVTTPVAFAALPVGSVGMVRTVTDSNTVVWGATIAAGGANKVLAFFNGSNWTVAGK